MIKNRHGSVKLLLSALISTSLWTSPSVAADNSFSEAITGGKLIANSRLRYEHVDQDGFSEDADAVTIRLRLGYQTGSWYGFSALGELDGTTHLGQDDFDSKENGKTSYPVVADPNSFRLNRLNLKYDGIPDTSVKLGRQRIILDDARFVGNVGWRQNEQTFDAIRISNNSIKMFDVNYAYLWRVNSIFGSEVTLGEYDADAHLADIQFSYSPEFKLKLFGHFLDFEDGKEATSLATYGVRANGSFKVNEEFSLGYGATFAHQTDHGENTADIDENYYSVSANAKWNRFKLAAGYDVFEGDGTVAFQTPLATGHKFQGFADVFLTTPADGLEDLHVSLSYNTAPFWYFSKGINILAAYHDFEAENNSTDMGYEFDAVVSAAFDHGFKVVAKFADYYGEDFSADRTKFMLGLNFNY